MKRNIEIHCSDELKAIQKRLEDIRKRFQPSENTCQLSTPPKRETLRARESRNMSAEQTEDLKAFERRLTEVIDKLQPTARLWRMVLIVISVCTAVGAWTWLWDSQTKQISLTQSLMNHPFFTISCFFLILLFLCGIHKRVVAPSIIGSRCRQVLTDFNMSCDETGKLILKPRHI
ncbi:nuclear envelope phosphatase-regulatory subunit 1-like isoform X2 [Saccostrea cucullata]|uniref:nuclear envelope phosphatase-regulatory subunit 1-like isoform X2 n=1 Tax=Saccostrea cuccullata TaxID=36930 RepID=UPI002ED23960